MRSVLQNVGQFLSLVVALSVIVFVLTNLLPGDPTLSILGEQATLEQRTQTRAEYGLDRPLPVRYVSWLGRAVQGDLGRSLRTGQPVVAILAERLPVTFELTFLGMLIAILIGKASPAMVPLRNVLPLVVLLAVWTGFGLTRRRRQARELLREIGEIEQR